MHKEVVCGPQQANIKSIKSIIFHSKQHQRKEHKIKNFHFQPFSLIFFSKFILPCKNKWDSCSRKCRLDGMSGEMIELRIKMQHFTYLVPFSRSNTSNTLALALIEIIDFKSIQSTRTFRTRKSVKVCLYLICFDCFSNLGKIERKQREFESRSRSQFEQTE